jgi:hypothetical protein
MSRVKCSYNYKGTGRQVFYDDATGEILSANFPVVYKNDFLNPVVDETNDVAVQEEGTANAIAVNVAANGFLRINTGTEADKANNASGELVWIAGQNLVFQCKLKTTTSDAGLLLFAGMSDAKAEGTGKIAIKDGSLASGSVDAWADDLVGFGVRAETSDKIYALSCNAAGTPQTTDTGYDLTLSTDYVLEIVCDASGNAKFYIDGNQVASHALAITATDPLTWFVGGLITTGSTAALIDVDFVAAMQNRS